MYLTKEELPMRMEDKEHIVENIHMPREMDLGYAIIKAMSFMYYCTNKDTTKSMLILRSMYDAMKNALIFYKLEKSSDPSRPVDIDLYRFTDLTHELFDPYIFQDAVTTIASGQVNCSSIEHVANATKMITYVKYIQYGHGIKGLKITGAKLSNDQKKKIMAQLKPYEERIKIGLHKRGNINKTSNHDFVLTDMGLMIYNAITIAVVAIDAYMKAVVSPDASRDKQTMDDTLPHVTNMARMLIHYIMCDISFMDKYEGCVEISLDMNVVECEEDAKGKFYRYDINVYSFDIIGRE